MFFNNLAPLAVFLGAAFCFVGGVASPSIDLSECDVSKACLLDPPDCRTFEACNHIVTWKLLDSTHVRFEMAAGKNFTFIAFGLSVGFTADDAMGNTSVLACSYNDSASQVVAFNAHNANYNDVIADQPELGLRPNTTMRTNGRILCIVDREIKPDSSLDGIVFPLDQPWYPAWASGEAKKDGLLQYHGKTRRIYNDLVICTESKSPSNHSYQATTTVVPPLGPIFNMTDCEISKGCYRYPAGCDPNNNCQQIVTWTVSPDDPAAVRFEMTTMLTASSKYVAFGLTVNKESPMLNTSVLVCAVNQTSSSATVYLSHNAHYTSTPLPAHLARVGLDLIHGELRNSHVICVVDRKILPTADQLGVAFPLYLPFYPLVAVGPADNNGRLHKHSRMPARLPGPIALTDYTSQTSIDLSFCGIDRGCLVDPPDCKSLADCKHAITWHALQSPQDYVRFELSTTASDFIAFGLAASPDMAFMKNGSVLACAKNLTNGEMLAYHSHNHPVESQPPYTSSMAVKPFVGLRPMMLAASGSRVSCVIDQSVMPDSSLRGLIFPLNEDWFPAWSAGPTHDGLLQKHTEKKYYTSKINPAKSFVTVPGGPAASIYRKLHGAFMILGWMLCVGCSVLTPRYLRKHWSEIRVFSLELWFVVHRSAMLLGIASVVTALVLIFYENNFYLTKPQDYEMHPALGLAAATALFLNPFVSLLRCKPDDKKRPIFNFVHGFIGLGGLALAAINMVFGAMMFEDIYGSWAIYSICVWLGVHAVTEFAYLLIYLAGYGRDAEKTPLTSNADATSDSPGSSGSHLSRIVKNDDFFDSFTSSAKLANGVFFLYLACTLITAFTAVAFVCVDNSNN